MAITVIPSRAADEPEKEASQTGRRIAAYSLAGVVVAGGVAFDLGGLRLWINLAELEERAAVRFLMRTDKTMSTPQFYPAEVETLATGQADVLEYYLRPRTT
jgi:hypothetical protein